MQRQGRHESDFRAERLRVWFTGTTALKKGQGLCFDRDHGTAATQDAGRTNNVELPSTTNHRWFAGVTTQAYDANSSGQYIDIYVPGSDCMVLVGANTVAPSGITPGTVLHCAVSTGCKGLFVNPGYTGLLGRGAAIALTTQTNVIVSDFTGAASVSSTTLTDTGNLGSVADGDICYIFGGDGGTVTPQELTCTAVDANTCTLSAAPGNGNVTYVIVRNDPTCICHLVGGDVESGWLRSGCCEFISPEDDAAAQHMVGGNTFVCGGYSLSTDVSTATLADGTLSGEMKFYMGLGTLGSNGYKVTCTSAIQKDYSTQLANATIDAAGEYGVLTWQYSEWISGYSSWTEA